MIFYYLIIPVLSQNVPVVFVREELFETSGDSILEPGSGLLPRDDMITNDVGFGDYQGDDPTILIDSNLSPLELNCGADDIIIKLNPDWFTTKNIPLERIKLGSYENQIMPDTCRVRDDWSLQLDISTRLNWEKCGFIQKLTSDGQRLIYENQLRTWDRIG